MDPSILDLLGNYAFPIIVAIFLLWDRRNDRALIDKLRDTIDANTKATNEMIAVLRSK